MRSLVPFLILLTTAVANEDAVVIDGRCRHAVEQYAPEVFLEFRFPDAHEIEGDWRFHSATSKEDPTCKIATLDIDEIPDYAVALLPRRAPESGFGLFALTSFWSDGTVQHTVYPLHAETRGVIPETLLPNTKRKVLRDDGNQVLSRGRGWLQIRSPHEGEEFAWCRNLDHGYPKRDLDSIEYVLALSSEKMPTRIASFHWNTAGHFTRRSYCRID